MIFRARARAIGAIPHRGWRRGLWSPASRLAGVAPSHRRATRQRGQGMVEYALVLVLVAALVVAGITLLGSRTAGLYSTVSAGLQLKSPAAKASATPKPTPKPKATPTPSQGQKPKSHKQHHGRGTPRPRGHHG